MAKQNFIAGGYVGKLGETVGQRWKNIRTVRVYVIPHNPRTPAQQACRRKFAEAVPYAQIGMQFNSKAPCWEATNKTEWQGRMSVAKVNIDNGVSGRNAIPLFPLGYTPANQITATAFMDNGSGDYTLFLTGSQDIETGRRFMLSIECENTVSGEIEEVMVEAVATGAMQNTVTLHLEGHVLDEGDIIFGVSCNDADFSGALCHVPPQTLQLANVVVVDDWVVTQNATTLALTVTSEKLKALASDYSLQSRFKVRDVFTGEYTEASQTYNIPAGTGTLTFRSGASRTALVGNSYFGGGGLVFSDGTNIYTLPNVPTALAGKYRTTWDATGGSPQWLAQITVDTGEEVSKLSVEVEFVMDAFPTLLDSAAVVQVQTVATFLQGGVQHTSIYRITDGELDDTGASYIFRWLSDDSGMLPDTPQTGTLSSAEYSVETADAVITGSYVGNVAIDE